MRPGALTCGVNVFTSASQGRNVRRKCVNPCSIGVSGPIRSILAPKPCPLAIPGSASTGSSGKLHRPPQMPVGGRFSQHDLARVPQHQQRYLALRQRLRRARRRNSVREPVPRAMQSMLIGHNAHFGLVRVHRTAAPDPSILGIRFDALRRQLRSAISHNLRATPDARANRGRRTARQHAFDVAVEDRMPRAPTRKLRAQPRRWNARSRAGQQGIQCSGNSPPWLSRRSVRGAIRLRARA